MITYNAIVCIVQRIYSMSTKRGMVVCMYVARPHFMSALGGTAKDGSGVVRSPGDDEAH